MTIDDFAGDDELNEENNETYRFLLSVQAC